MLFVLLFLVFTGLVYMYRLRRVGKLKKSFQNLKIARNCKADIFFAKPLLLDTEEAKLVLSQFGVGFAKALDEVLKKIRLNSVSNLVFGLKDELEKYNIKTLPLYCEFANDSAFNLQVLDFAAQICDVSIIIFFSKPKDYFSEFPNLRFEKQNPSAFVSFAKKLDINLPVPQKVERFFQRHFIEFSTSFKNERKLFEGQYIEEFENKNFKILKCNFFVGESICTLKIKNKTIEEQNLKFDVFFDLALGSINYYNFKQSKNFVRFSNILDEKAHFFNFSQSPQKIEFSAVKDMPQSNLPCVKLSYNEKIEPKAEMEFAFMLSNNPHPLKLLTKRALFDFAKEYMESFFCMEIFLQDSHFSTVFNKHIKNKAISELTDFSFKEIPVVKRDFKTLKMLFEKQQISALSFYVSVKQALLTESINSFEVDPYFFEGDFMFSLMVDGKTNLIKVRQNASNTPCLLLKGVRYYNNLCISKQILSEENSISIEC